MDLKDTFTDLTVPTQPIMLPDLRPGSPLDDFYITLPGLPSSTEVQAYAEKHASSTPKSQTDPTWATLCILLGAFLLVVSGLALITLGSMVR